jgi:hypothetical protein
MQYLGLTLALMLSACSFRVAGDSGGGGDLSMADVDLGAGGGGGGGGGGSGGDLATGNDLAGLPIVCTAGSSSCSGSTLVRACRSSAPPARRRAAARRWSAAPTAPPR